MAQPDAVAAGELGTGRKRLRTKWLEPNADQARRANVRERRLAARLGGKRLPQSGGRLWSKYDKTALASSVVTDGGDLGTKDFHFESKGTEGKSLGVSREWLDKVGQGAKRQGKDPAIVLTFEGTKQPRRAREDWVVLPIEVFERLRRLASKD